MSRPARVLGVAIMAMLPYSSAEASPVVLRGVLDAAQVVDGGGSTSAASGFGLVTIDTDLFTITTDLSWSGLSGPADRAHLHDAPAGDSRLVPPNDNVFHEVLSDASRIVQPCPWSGAVFTDCAPASGSSHDVLQLSAGDGYGFADFNALLSAFLRDGVYLDIHTEVYPAGEIRGQLDPVPEPVTFVLFGTTMGGLGFAARWKWRKVD